jgi:hypothetical protein
MRMIVAASIATALAAALASTAAAQVPTQDSVTGEIRTGNERADLVFTFDAHSGPSGESPTGTVAIYTFVAGPLGTFAVSCLGVHANRATVVVPFPQAAPPTPAGIVIYVEDNGSSGDKVDYDFVSSLPTSCLPPSTVFERPDIFGDVTVIDAQSLPTSKDRCKDGGWRTFGVFKNQGDCVSFVATGGKNPPAGAGGTERSS